MMVKTLWLEIYEQAGTKRLDEASHTIIVRAAQGLDAVHLRSDISSCIRLLPRLLNPASPNQRWSRKADQLTGAFDA